LAQADSGTVHCSNGATEKKKTLVAVCLWADDP